MTQQQAKQNEQYSFPYKYSQGNFPRVEYQQDPSTGLVSAIGSSPTVNNLRQSVEQQQSNQQLQYHGNGNNNLPAAGIPLHHVLVQPQQQTQQSNSINGAFGGRISGQKHLATPPSNPVLSQPRHPVLIERLQPIPQQQPSRMMKQPNNHQNIYHRNKGTVVSPQTPLMQQMQSSASEVSSGQSLQQQQPQTVMIPMSSGSVQSVNNIPMGMPVPGLLMTMAKQEQQLNQQQPQMSLAHHLATQMLKAALEDRAMRVSRRRSKRSLEKTSEEKDSLSREVSDQEAQESGFPGFPFDDSGIPPPLFDGPSGGPLYSPRHIPSHHENNLNDFASGSRRRSHTQGRPRGARRSSGINESGSHPKKSFGMLGSGNFEVIRGGIYREDGDGDHSGHGSSRVRGYRHPGHSSDGDYDDTASSKKQYSSGYPSGSPGFIDEDYFPGVMGFQGFDNFQLASNQEEEMKKVSEDMESESLHPHQSMSATRIFPVVVDSEQDLMATA